MYQETYRNILKQNSVSNTKSRQIVFDALLSLSEPIHMKGLIEICAIDRVSVYRTIELFERLNIAKKIQIGWKYKLELGDAFHAHHHHMTCTKCDAVIEFEETPELDIALNYLVKQANFSMKQRTLEIRGLCANCQKRLY